MALLRNLMFFMFTTTSGTQWDDWDDGPSRKWVIFHSSVDVYQRLFKAVAKAPCHQTSLNSPTSFWGTGLPAASQKVTCG